MKLGEVCLCTNQVVRLADFYRRLLGIAGQDDNPVHQTLVQTEPMLTIYDDGSSKNNANQNICLAFTVDNVDAEAQRLCAWGVALQSPPTTQPWGARNLSFLDPDGNLVYLRQLPHK